MLNVIAKVAQIAAGVVVGVAASEVMDKCVDKLQEVINSKKDEA